jgi:hypothetical protein
MSTTAADPVALIEQLDAADLRRQIAELDRQRRALAVLLRAAAARERQRDRAAAPPEGQEVAHAG